VVFVAWLLCVCLGNAGMLFHSDLYVNVPSTHRSTANMVEEEACDEEAVCYLCLDGGVDKSDQPLRRDCACRGTDAGFVHLSCLTGFASTKSMLASGMIEWTPGEVIFGFRVLRNYLTLHSITC
jgi:hypothetical protein